MNMSVKHNLRPPATTELAEETLRSHSLANLHGLLASRILHKDPKKEKEKKRKKKEKESVRKREKMGGIRERKTVRSFLRCLNPKFQSLLILFLRLFFPRNKHKPISHNNTHIFYLFIYFIVLIFSKSHRTSLS